MGLNDAIRKIYDPNGVLNQDEYYELMKWVKVHSQEGREACNALATARSQDYRAFRNLYTRDKYAEEKYAPLGTVKSGGGCYLTTACMKATAEKFDDSCYELKTLRMFRDTYMKSLYPNEVTQYYDLAPRIVNEIEKDSDNALIFKQIYKELIIPVIRLIESKQLEDAHILYKEYSCKLANEYITGLA